tara:strand:- start:343 stop:513 length:171 start_codon:yes stop_codon:yes gene_type:complete
MNIIIQKRRLTIEGRYHYQRREIRTDDEWVQTLGWKPYKIRDIIAIEKPYRPRRAA